MNYFEDINNQWQELSKIIESEVIRDIKFKKKVDNGSLNVTFEAEKTKWNSNVNYRGIWLSSLARENAPLASEVNYLLKKFKLEHKHGIKTLSSVPYVLFASLLVVVTIVILFSIDMVVWKQLLGVVVISSFITTLLLSVFNSQKEKMKRKIVTYYQEQLQRFKNELVECNKNK